MTLTTPIPMITQQDIDWICEVMNLEPLDETRNRFLSSLDTLDISACPGSGKTTLVIAKLAILAHKWNHRTKGICILSHTNVAREEIQSRLGSTIIGHGLLNYPHYIDTIHGFINKFLAIPWLLSNGLTPHTIDNDVTEAHRRRNLSLKEFNVLNGFLKRKYLHLGAIRICDRDFGFNVASKKFPANPGTNSHNIAKTAIGKAAAEGYFCHEEMFVFAKALLSDFPQVASFLRRRFPIVLIDEMQDTAKEQIDILELVFPRASKEVIVQRIGDPNQAIFDDHSPDGDGENTFPDLTCMMEISNSFRFNQGIASLASPFSVSKVGDLGLLGVGPKRFKTEQDSCKNVIYIFDNAAINMVLEAFAKDVLLCFSEQALEGNIVAAVGAIHRDYPEVDSNNEQFPKTVSHYWSGSLLSQRFTFLTS